MQACVCACVCFLTEMRKSEVRKRNVISKKVNKLLDIMSHVHTHTQADTYKHLVTVRTCTCLTFAFVLAHVGLNFVSHSLFSLSSISMLSDWCVDHVRKLCCDARANNDHGGGNAQREQQRERERQRPRRERAEEHELNALWLR